MSSRKQASLKGSIFLSGEDRESFAADRVRLLAAIDEHGSISAAARAVGISYKTAWDRIDAMNNMSDGPLVVRSAGGARGGGTVLTDLGRRIVEGFRALEAEHEAFVDQLGESLHSVSDVAGFIRGSRLWTSARNQYRGRVVAITPGAVNTEVEIGIGDSVTLTALITHDSRQRMALQKGDEVIALIKSSWVLLSPDIHISTSARNRLAGTIGKITPGEVDCEVSLDLEDGKTICAVITNTSARALDLKEGDEACALFKASSVILMRD